MGYAWYSAWRGKVGLGIQQWPDDNTLIYPWMNAPPGTKQEMGIFFLLGAGTPQATLDRVLAYTHKDIYPHMDGYVTCAPHWHFAYTEQAVANRPKWVPPFKTVLEKIGVDALAMIMDFHIDGHPQDLTGLRLRELDQYYKACRAVSDNKFLFDSGGGGPSVILAGATGRAAFPKPVFWMMDRKPGEALRRLMRVWDRVSCATLKTCGGWSRRNTDMSTKRIPRTKGSTGYPDKIEDTSCFRDSRYFGTAGWKAMPSDLSLCTRRLAS